jgi:hypothetical protein
MINNNKLLLFVVLDVDVDLNQIDNLIFLVGGEKAFENDIK